MSFFSHLRQRGCYNPHMGSGYYQQPPMQPSPYNPAPSAPMTQCQSCQAMIAVGSSFCPACGKRTAQNLAKRCGQCGAAVPPDANFCAGCGSKV